MLTTTDSPSKGQINRAGDTLREWWNAPGGEPLPEAAAEILLAYRAGFQDPMKKVTVGLRQFVKREQDPAIPITVGQRLKRAPQIVEKLARHPKMSLARMQDIGGCRAILVDHDHVMRVAARIERNWTIKHRKHYTLEEPAPSGYRALHLVVEREGRLIEIQLRTETEHDWAEAVERTAKRVPYNLKAGEGPAVVLQFFRLASDGLALETAGRGPSDDFVKQFEEVRARALRILGTS